MLIRLQLNALKCLCCEHAFIVCLGLACLLKARKLSVNSCAVLIDRDGMCVKVACFYLQIVFVIACMRFHRSIKIGMFVDST